MRVDYTLPSLEPEKLPELPASVETGVSFREQLLGTPSDLTVNWQKDLNLDTRPPDATYLEPPTRPKTMDIRDPGTERKRGRGMLTRHSNAMASASPQGSNDQHPVRVMLDMLTDMQQSEDSIVSQNAALSRG
jgi:hypothetical protein